ncbi:MULTISPECIES: hypothetical protein [unclassified Bradyrhizobium]|uniref:hypothetical protein n=1 Tax=unclassified Bradyrhizobium TaxID=2631580 RepID=UPI002479ED4A|nr:MULTISPECIES: hypothetical protein [unclassified Bradyrhizobium]WGR73296.1 hypothetical protein MTX24_10935 [Bradyrhizobium sp. ISRA426]WGR78133.1 hypothetical protein MTX21_35905 [Bradyrhizobium sp. ISRA430]WGR88534.1 hypothetical protein MTX25_10945 [Bradyrhizobium sp. ISRA432]
MKALTLAVAIALSFPLAAALAAPGNTTSCSTNGICYCTHDYLSDPIRQRVAEIRNLIATQRAQGKAIGYLSVPLTGIGGGLFPVNALVAMEAKERVEQQFGPRDVWVLNPAAPEFSLAADANGVDYMWMWTQILEGEGPEGLGAFDFVYFIGPSDFARHFGLDGHADLEKLDTAYDNLVKTKPDLAAKVDKRSFRDYYGVRASVSFSYGSHDEWNIVRTINAKRRAADSTAGFAKQMGVFFDEKPVAPGLLEVPVDVGNAGACKTN